MLRPRTTEALIFLTMMRNAESVHGPGSNIMNDGYIYQQFGVWWVFIESTVPGPIRLSGPYRTREHAEDALNELNVVVTLPSAS